MHNPKDDMNDLRRQLQTLNEEELKTAQQLVQSEVNRRRAVAKSIQGLDYKYVLYGCIFWLVVFTGFVVSILSFISK